MNRATSAATEGPHREESDSALPIPSDNDHGALHTDCVLDRACSKRGTGASESHKASLHPLKPTLPIQRPQGPLRKGVQPRRLAGGGENSEGAGGGPGPSSPDFSELCAELGFWSPSNTLPGEKRSSPGFVESFFTSLDQSVRQSPAQTPPPAAAPTFQQLLPAGPRAVEKRPVGDEVSDEGAAWSPSWKVARISAPSGAGVGSSSQLMGAASSTASPSSSQAASILSGAATGVVPPQVPGSGPHSQHPLVRLPTLEPGVRTRQFFASEIKVFELSSRSVAPTLPRMRELLRKQSLNSAEAYDLLICAESLARHVYHFMHGAADRLKPTLAATHLGRRFMAIYYLVCASQALKQNWSGQTWWKELMNRLPHSYFYAVGSLPQASRFHVDLAKDLSSAIAQLKRGLLPSVSVTIDLQKRLMCMPNSPRAFKKRQWDPWRYEIAGL